ncbi:hypothetical protein GLV94_04810 [Virgibacillus halodenitrificans]|uniref:hypothetical protein n=1 Tax=Virgibacillus halodenitrificans TaxID=1482 RepID=UPI00045D01EE|nr:hypothetical protein [Virgibacillus halodenitrificans]MCG1029074.1 hypothetical protein [Virgibacillus halodenitrificans]MYL44954.1 hypothetical protein [Virgibacillus halodenitrificans]CDQ35310.1 hypothetical protein BN993_04780 [Virgibacillus halodenitrificans]
MKKQNFLFILLIGLMLLAGCSDSADQAEEKNKEAQNHEKKEENQKQDKKSPYIEAYKPIQPSKEAVALEKNYTEEEQKLMPANEAHGGERERSVPLGQTLQKGKEDKTNGPLKDHRLVAFYGTPLSENMGILGEYGPEEMMKKLKEHTKAYSELDPERPAIPTIELIATVANRDPGPDGLYVSPPNEEVIEEYAKLAKKHGALLLLDIQLGRATVMQEVKAIEKYLKLPYVHLAIDTEYSVQEGEVPGEDLGQVNGADVQKAVEYVDQLVEENQLPDKLVLVHQFGNGIIKNKEKIHPTEHVQVPLNYDGFGDAAIKLSAYGKLVKDQPIQYGGFKVFKKNDKPVLTPEQVLQLDPAPAIVNYQ